MRTYIKGLTTDRSEAAQNVNTNATTSLTGGKKRPHNSETRKNISEENAPKKRKVQLETQEKIFDELVELVNQYRALTKKYNKYAAFFRAKMIRSMTKYIETLKLLKKLEDHLESLDEELDLKNEQLTALKEANKDLIEHNEKMSAHYKIN